MIGFGLMAKLGAQAAILAAGGYTVTGREHLGERGAPPPPPGTAALRHATTFLPDESERTRLLERVEHAGLDPSESDGSPLVQDPSANALRLVVTGSNPKAPRVRPGPVGHTRS